MYLVQSDGDLGQIDIKWPINCHRVGLEQRRNYIEIGIYNTYISRILRPNLIRVPPTHSLCRLLRLFTLGEAMRMLKNQVEYSTTENQVV